MADTLTAVVTTDSATYKDGQKARITITFTNGDVAQTIVAINNLSGPVTDICDVADLMGTVIPVSAATAYTFDGYIRTGQAANLVQSLNWGFQTTGASGNGHNLGATAASVTISPPAGLGGVWPSYS